MPTRVRRQVGRRNGGLGQRGGSGTKVFASVDDVAWRTSVWRDRTGRTLLPVPKKVRGDSTDGAVVQVTLRY
jgi:hypothetical protein